MKHDPFTVGCAKVAAELVAEVVNQMVERISFKTWVRALKHYHINATIDPTIKFFFITSLSFLPVFVSVMP